MSLTIHYSIAMSEPQTHLFEVTVEVSGWTQAEAVLALPVWTPGSYLIREFARHVQDFTVQTWAGAGLAWQRVDKARWSIATGGVGSFRVIYRVYANDLTVRTSHLDDSHGYFNGSNVFMYLEGLILYPVTLSVQPPQGWHVSLALPQTEQGVYEASSYDLLADSPAEVGTHPVWDFQALGKPHQVAVWGHGNIDEARTIADLGRIVETVAAMFGGELPYDRYLFIVHLGDRLGGGLEHLNSTTLAVDRWTFAPPTDYQKFLRLAAHEFFHVWNVKRIRPATLGPFDYTKEVDTSLLWVMEGFTTYYDLLLVQRAGLATPAETLRQLSERLAAYWGQPGRTVMSVEEAARLAWIRLYRPDENSINASISYYLKGALVALVLDMRLRDASANHRSLDDVMRALWQEWGERDQGFTEAEFCATVERAGGLPLDDFLARFVRGIDELPLTEALALAGLDVRHTRKRETPEAWTGLALQTERGAVTVKHVLRGSPAEAGGIMAKDRLVALDDFEIRDEAFLQARLREWQPGDAITLHVFRYGQLLARTLTLHSAPPDEVILTPRAHATPRQRRIAEAWLGVPWEQLHHPMGT